MIVEAIGSMILYIIAFLAGIVTIGLLALAIQGIVQEIINNWRRR